MIRLGACCKGGRENPAQRPGQPWSPTDPHKKKKKKKGGGGALVGKEGRFQFRVTGLKEGEKKKKKKKAGALPVIRGEIARIREKKGEGGEAARPVPESKWEGGGGKTR